MDRSHALGSTAQIYHWIKYFAYIQDNYYIKLILWKLISWQLLMILNWPGLRWLVNACDLSLEQYSACPGTFNLCDGDTCYNQGRQLTGTQMIHTVGYAKRHMRTLSTSWLSVGAWVISDREYYQICSTLCPWSTPPVGYWIPKPTATLTQFILDCGSINLNNSYRLSYTHPGTQVVFRISRDWCFSIHNMRTKLLKQLKNNR